MLTDKKTLMKLNHILARYDALRFESVGQVPMEYCETRERYRREPEDAQWRPAKPGLKWGGDGITAWFRGEAKMPKSCAGRKVFLKAATGGVETLLLVNGSCQGVFDGNHPVRLVALKGSPRKRLHISLEAYSGHWHPGSGMDVHPPRIEPKSRVFEEATLMLEREDVSAFVFDLKVLLQLVDVLGADNRRAGEVARGLVRVFEVVDAKPTEQPEERWRPKLAQARKLMRPLLDAKNGDTAPRMGIVGHSHLDTAWLWPLAETWRKAARTFSSILSLMDEYPEFIFTQSAPCHMDAVRRFYPEVFKRVKTAVRQGRWEPNGAMWVEPDCNIPSGESFVRQLLIGQQTTRDMFGYTADTLWLPDVFGYSAALPQLLQQAGVEFFCTTKISWNDTTRFPYDTFLWKGIDGTPVVSHFNAIHCWPDPQTLSDQWNWVQHKDAQDRRLSAFGFGDGGGGPQAEMLEMARRMKDLEGCPRTEYTTVSDFMKGIQERGRDLPEWSGELYLEFHRGTLTSIAPLKRGNRKAEFALRDAEFFAVMAAMAGKRYPGATLSELWKTLLTNQFHDILPGSSIAQVNDEAIAALEEVCRGAEEIVSASLAKLGFKPVEDAQAVAIFNTLSWDRTGELVLEGVPRGMRPEDPEVDAQWISDPDGVRKLVVAGIAVPALGATALPLRKGRPTGKSPFKVHKTSVETPFAWVRFDKAGRITSFIDKMSGRQLVRGTGAFNELLIGEDVPGSYDNWELDADHRIKLAPETRLEEREIAADGPLQLRLRSTYRLGDASRMVQDMVFHAKTPRVDFETVVDWKETHNVLKVGFDTDIMADFARHEIQFGHVERPTHTNLPQDRARFEVCAHKWTDLSENGFGLAVLNDCKYGIGVRNGELRLTLLKSGVHPDARGDHGTHRFTYSLLPHVRGFSAGSVVRPAYELNVPVRVIPVKNAGKALETLIEVDASNVVVESVKWAEADDGFIVRLYEAGKTGTWVRMRVNAAYSSVSETNLLEEEPRDVGIRGEMLRLYMRPFEVKTLYFKTR